MVKAIETYLVTDGNGLEAVDFYKKVFHAEVASVVLWKDQIPDCPTERAHLLLNAQLNIDGIRLMISDENPDYAYRSGANMTAAIIVDDVAEAHVIYDRLKVDAQQILLEIGETFWSPAYANLIDKFGMTWQISTELPN